MGRNRYTSRSSEATGQGGVLRALQRMYCLSSTYLDL